MCAAIVARNRRLFAADPGFAQITESKVPAIVRICRGWSDGAGMPQGYTYLGQFLAHEIVSREPPHPPTSARSRKLDLDSVYGAGARFDERGCFLYTAATDGYAKDLLRDPLTKAACIPEFRNDEHPIISQLHLTIQLFHNATLRAIRASASGAKLGALECFETAREYVVATLQRIYAEDYLRECSDPVIHALYTERSLEVFEIPPHEAQLPYEITHAAMRFGHSQVRESYLLNASETETDLGDLFLLTGLFGGAGFRGIPIEKAVDWRRFFYWGSASAGIKADSARRINPNVVAPMSKLLEPPIEDIVVRNIEAGIRTHLPSGQAVARRLQALGIDSRIQPSLQLQPDDAQHGEALREAGLWDETPLWLYVLIEASALGGDGLRLGPLGSVFLCETIRQALAGARSYRDVQAHCRREFGLEEIASFVELVKFAEPRVYGD